MIAPRLEIDLGKIHHNTRILVERLARRGISVTAVTKAILGMPEVARAFLDAGASALGDSRIENIERMGRDGIAASMILIRTPMMSDAGRVVAHVDSSFNTELGVIKELSTAACEARRTHGVVLMVELGDLREGIMPDDLVESVRELLRFPNIALRGIGTNLACRSGVAPSEDNMTELSELADSIDSTFGTRLDVVSGGNSGNLRWAFGDGGTGRINNLRLGESLLLGRESLQRQAIEGLHTDAFTLVAEVIESKTKPSLPWGEIGQNAFAEEVSAADIGNIRQAIVAIGNQDVDPTGLLSPPGMKILGASSDHLILNTGSSRLSAGAVVEFQLDYRALLRAMTSPFVGKVITSQTTTGGRSSWNEDRART